MADFRLRYQVYLRAESRSATVAKIGAGIVMLLVIVPLCWVIGSSVKPSGWRAFLFLVAAVVMCVAGAVADYWLKRRFLKLFYAQGLRKVGEYG